VQSDGTLTVISGSVRDFGVEASHIAEVRRGTSQIAYVANASSDQIASYTISRTGRLRLRNQAAAQLPALSKAVDMAIDSSGSYLYILTQKTGSITGYTINADASLTQITSVNNLPTSGTWGLAGF
jgi:6-phosphogluconolactonase (cycloisomerase 2 family)